MSIILDVVFVFVFIYLSFLLFLFGNKKYVGIIWLISIFLLLFLIVFYSLVYLFMVISFMNCIDVWKIEIGVVVWIGFL